MNTTITPRTTVADLVVLGVEQLRAEQLLDRTTIDEYERVLRNLLIPSLGTTIIGELTTSLIDELLVDLGAQSLNQVGEPLVRESRERTRQPSTPELGRDGRSRMPSIRRVRAKAAVGPEALT